MEITLNNHEQDENFQKLNSGSAAKKQKNICEYESMENEVCPGTNNQTKNYIQWIATFTSMLT